MKGERTNLVKLVGLSFGEKKSFCVCYKSLCIKGLHCKALADTGQKETSFSFMLLLPVTFPLQKVLSIRQNIFHMVTC